MIEGSAYKAEVESKNIMAVPTVYLNGAFFESGRMGIKDILSKIGSTADPSELSNKDPYDVLVIGEVQQVPLQPFMQPEKEFAPELLLNVLADKFWIPLALKTSLVSNIQKARN